MNKKAEQEYKQLIKLGVTESLSRIIVLNKHCPESEETKMLLEDEIREQNDLRLAIEQFNFKSVGLENKISVQLSSTDILYDQNKNTTI